MGPYLGPFAAAFLAALGAGLVLGIVRLSRRSLEWWTRRKAPAVLPGALEAMADVPAFVPLPEFPGVNGAIACAAAASLLIGFAALAPDAVPHHMQPTIPAHPFEPASLLPHALRNLAFAGAAVASTLALAIASALIEGGLRFVAARVSARVVQLRALHIDALAMSPLSIADLRAGASALWSGVARGSEPFGVGLSYVALFVTPVAAVALVARAALGPLLPGWAPLFATLFLAVPAAYAAAAERSQRDLGARLRRRAAVRQLLAAPAWGFALLALGLPQGGPLATASHAAAWLALVCAALLALPGTTSGRGLLELPGGGDESEPSAVVRAISGLAHHAWLGAWAAFVAIAFVREARLLVPIALLALAALLALRAIVTGLLGARSGPVLLASAWTLALLDMLAFALRTGGHGGSS